MCSIKVSISCFTSVTHHVTVKWWNLNCTLSLGGTTKLLNKIFYVDWKTKILATAERSLTYDPMGYNSTNINKTNNHLSPKIIEHKKATTNAFQESADFYVGSNFFLWKFILFYEYFEDTNGVVGSQ